MQEGQIHDSGQRRGEVLGVGSIPIAICECFPPVSV